MPLTEEKTNVAPNTLAATSMQARAVASENQQKGTGFYLGELFTQAGNGPMSEIIKRLSTRDFYNFSETCLRNHQALYSPYVGEQVGYSLGLEGALCYSQSKYQLWKVLFRLNTDAAAKDYFLALYPQDIVDKLTISNSKLMDDIENDFNWHKNPKRKKLEFSDDQIPKITIIKNNFDDVSSEKILRLIDKVIDFEIELHAKLFKQFLSQTDGSVETFEQFQYFLSQESIVKNIAQYFINNGSVYRNANYVLSKKELMLLKKVNEQDIKAILSEIKDDDQKKNFIALLLHGFNCGVITTFNEQNILDYAGLGDAFKRIILQGEKLRELLKEQERKQQELELLQSSLHRLENEFSREKIYIIGGFRDLRDGSYSKAYSIRDDFDSLVSVCKNLEDIADRLSKLTINKDTDEFVRAEKLLQDIQLQHQEILSMLKNEVIKNIWWDIKKDLLYSGLIALLFIIGFPMVLTLIILFPPAGVELVKLAIVGAAYTGLFAIGGTFPGVIFFRKLYTVITGNGVSEEDKKLIELANDIKTFVTSKEAFKWPTIVGSEPVEIVIDTTIDGNESPKKQNAVELSEVIVGPSKSVVNEDTNINLENSSTFNESIVSGGLKEITRSVDDGYQPVVSNTETLIHTGRQLTT